MVQFGGFGPSSLISTLLANSLVNSISESLKNSFAFKLVNEAHANSVKELKNAVVNAGPNTLCKKVIASGITLTNNKTKAIIKAI